jgi:energy-coupling factor transporter ATP-binding protein EcfA2
MVVRLFVLGRPGSGKSTVRRYIARLAQHQFWSPYSTGDYVILQHMCDADRDQTRIRHAEFGGFEVLDFPVLDDALHIMQHRVEKALEKHELEQPRIAIIEFARSDYVQALSQFDPVFLKDASFLILESDIDTCISRIKARTRYRQSEDDIFVPVNIMEDYYQTDSTSDTVHNLQEAFGLESHQIQLMRTDGSRNEFLHDCVRLFAQTLLNPASQSRRITRPLAFSHNYVSSTETHPILCPPSLPNFQQEEEVSEPVEDTRKDQRVEAELA